MPQNTDENKREDTTYEVLGSKLLRLNDSSGAIREIIQEYDSFIDQIFLKIKSVQGIANKTNLLAINASIETIHASDLLASFEEIVTKSLIIEAKIIAQIIEHDPDFIYQDEAKFASECFLEEFLVTDGQGVIQITNKPACKNTAITTKEILRILDNPELEVTLPTTGNGLDDKRFKVIGISRNDRDGIIQIGAHFARPRGQLAVNGFGVVAQEAKRLADISKSISTRITLLTNELHDKLDELDKTFEVVAEIISKRIEASKLLTGESGAKVEDEAMQEWKTKLTAFEASLWDSRKYFRDILSSLKELINVARQTNLLGVRAAIEAAHSTNEKMDFDNLLNRHMTSEAKLVAFLLERRPNLTYDEMVELANHIEIGELWVADENATVELTNILGGKGFVYKNEGQTAPFLQIIANPDLVVTQPPTIRPLDNKVFKYVGVGRRDKGGFVQVAQASKIYGESTAEGFATVAKKIKNLAEQSKEIATEIEAMMEVMDFKAQKVIDHTNNVQKYLLEVNLELDKIKLS